MIKSNVRNSQKTIFFFPNQFFTGIKAAGMVPSHLLFQAVLKQPAPLRKSLPQQRSTVGGAQLRVSPKMLTVNYDEKRL